MPLIPPGPMRRIVARRKAREKHVDPKIYEPFPAGEVPDGWPTSYVDLEEYSAMRDKYQNICRILNEYEAERAAANG